MDSKKLRCPSCDLSFTRRSNLNRHFQRFHLQSEIVEKCILCGQIFKNCQEIQNHYARFHKPSKKFFIKESAFNKKVVTYRFNYGEGFNDINRSQVALRPFIKKTILAETVQKTICKVGLIITAEMSMLDHAGEQMTTALIPFRAPYFSANASSPNAITQNINSGFNWQTKTMEEFCNSGSNWVYVRSICFDIEIAGMKPLLIGSNNKKDGNFEQNEEGQVSLRDLRNSKFLFNPKNTDEKCFINCISHYLYQTSSKNLSEKHFQKIFLKKLDLTGINFPISIIEIKKFIRKNSFLNLKINILIRDQKKIFPYEFGIGSGSKLVNLLMLHKQNKDETSSNHFLLIKNVNKFLRNVYQSNTGQSSYQKSKFCLNCLNRFDSDKKLKNHVKICSNNKPRKETCPEDGENIIQFKNFQKTSPSEYIAFLDFECVLPKVSEKCSQCSLCRCKCDISYTQTTSSQHPIAFCFIVLDWKNNIIHEKSFSGSNAAEVFLEHLFHEEERWIKSLLSQNNAMKFTKNDQKHFENQERCYMCLKKFFNTSGEKLKVKCRDHDHITGKYIGAACASCNISRQLPRKLPIFLHNGSRYDFHFVIKALEKFEKEIGQSGIKILPFNGENFRTISFASFTFLDTIAFLQSSLGQLSEDLSKTNHPYSILKQSSIVKTKGKFDTEKMELFLKKSFFPYEYWLVKFYFYFR